MSRKATPIRSASGVGSQDQFGLFFGSQIDRHVHGGTLFGVGRSYSREVAVRNVLLFDGDDPGEAEFPERFRNQNNPRTVDRGVDDLHVAVLFDRLGRKRQGVDCIQIDLIECFVQNGDVAFVAAGEHLVGRGDFLYLGDDVLVVRGHHLSSVIPVGLVSVILFGVVGCSDDHTAVAL